MGFLVVFLARSKSSFQLRNYTKFRRLLSSVNAEGYFDILMYQPLTEESLELL